MAAWSTSGASLFSPSVSRIAWRCCTSGTEPKTTPARSSQVLITVPPPARSCATAADAWAREVGVIWTMAGPLVTFG